MTTQTIERSTQSTCATCPYFQDFGGPNGRGWCRMFDHMARQHHKQTGDCKQEIEAVESAPQESVIGRKTQSAGAGLAGDSVSCQLRSPIGSGATRSPKQAPQELEPESTTDAEVGHCHGQQDISASRSHCLTSANAEVNVSKPPAWSVTFNERWGWYDAWAAKHWCGRAATHEEAERLAQRYIGMDEMIRRQNAAVMRSYAA